MNYQSILKLLATEHNCTTKEIEEEMCKALQFAGYNIEPEAFIAIAAQDIKTIYRN